MNFLTARMNELGASDKNKAIADAIDSGDLAAVQTVISGMNIKDTPHPLDVFLVGNRSGQTPMTYAAEKATNLSLPHLKMVEAMIDAGADVGLRSQGKHVSPLMLVVVAAGNNFRMNARFGHQVSSSASFAEFNTAIEGVFRKILSGGDDIYRRNRSYENAWEIAKRAGQYDVIAMLDKIAMKQNIDVAQIQTQSQSSADTNQPEDLPNDDWFQSVSI